MAMTKSYYYVNGEMIGYSDENGRKDVLTDALGNITGEIDETGELTYQARYSPLGKTISTIGSSSSGFGWVGMHGYRQTGLTGASHYVRARHYSFVSGIWTTVDPLWPSEMAYGYAECNPLLLIDPTGEATCSLIKDCRKDCTQQEADKMWGSIHKDQCRLEFKVCMDRGGYTIENFLLCKTLRNKCQQEMIGHCINKCLTLYYDFGPLCVEKAGKNLDDALAVCGKKHKDCLRNKKTRKAKAKCDSEYQLCIHNAGIVYNGEFRKCQNKK